MYTTKSGLILGFHGCDLSLAHDIVLHKQQFKESNNKYDWLGRGMYFWENSPARAIEFAENLKKNPLKGKVPIKTPAVIGAVIDLKYCLDLTEHFSLQTLKDAYEYYKELQEESGWELAKNSNPPAHSGNPDLLLRNLDCAVINTLHDFRKRLNLQPFDSVRGLFTEGGELYSGAKIQKKTHTQIAILNPDCIKGFFLPREKTTP